MSKSLNPVIDGSMLSVDSFLLSLHLASGKMETNLAFHIPGGGGGVLPYMGYIGMCSVKGYGFSAALVINRVSVLAFCRHFGNK